MKTWNRVLGAAIAALTTAACDHPMPTAPTAAISTPEPIVAARTSRVDPNSLEDSLLESLWLEHDVWAPGVELCITKPRTYCSEDGSRCADQEDYYTVMAPDRCPVEPIE